YTYTSAAPADGFTLDGSGTQSITLRYDRHEEVIPPVPGPDPDPVSTYHVTVRYLEVGTEKVLADNFATKSAPENSAYDVTAETALAIPGYTISSVDGTPAGRLNQNLLITVWYAPEQVIPEPGIPTTDLPEPALPNIPEDKVPTTDLPATETAGDQVIVEEGTPTTNLPQTGTVAAPVSPQWTLGLLALFSSMAAAGLVVLTSRRREDEAE
ncbi:MAG: MucBP domain-containing protein, partial [Pseudoflavonifractor sp.]